MRLYRLVLNSLFISELTSVFTLLDWQEVLPREEIFDDPRYEIYQSLEEKLILVDRFASITQQNLCIKVALHNSFFTSYFSSAIS